MQRNSVRLAVLSHPTVIALMCLFGCTFFCAPCGGRVLAATPGKDKNILSRVFSIFSGDDRYIGNGDIVDQPAKRLQGVAVRGRLLCGTRPMNATKVKLVDLDPRPDKDDLMAETATDEQGLFRLFGATREITQIDVIIKIYHDCNDDHKPCQRKVSWQIPERYHNNGTLDKWFDIGTVNMELIFPYEERDCRH